MEAQRVSGVDAEVAAEAEAGGQEVALGVEVGEEGSCGGGGDCFCLV